MYSLEYQSKRKVHEVLKYITQHLKWNTLKHRDILYLSAHLAIITSFKIFHDVLNNLRGNE